MTNTFLTRQEVAQALLNDMLAAGKKLAEETGMSEDEATLAIANAFSRRMFYGPQPR